MKVQKRVACQQARAHIVVSVIMDVRRGAGSMLSASTLSLATRKDKGLKVLSQNGYGPLGQEPPETSEAFMPSGLKLSVWTNNHEAQVERRKIVEGVAEGIDQAARFLT